MKKFLAFFIVLLSLSLVLPGAGMSKGKAASRPKQQVKAQQAPEPEPVPLPRGERSALAVMKLINTTSQDKGARYQPWEYGIAAMLATDLEQTAMFNLIDRMRLNDVIREHQLQQSGLTDPSTALAVGRLVTARFILTGTFMVVGQDIRINVQVFSVEKGIQLGAVSSTGRVDKFFVVEKEIYVKVAKVLRVVQDEDKQARIVQAVETKSVEASLKNYSGETALLRADELKKAGKTEESAGMIEFAIKMFREALEYDPDFERARSNISKMVNAIPMTL